MIIKKILIALALLGLVTACGGPSENAAVPEAEPAGASSAEDLPGGTEDAGDVRATLFAISNARSQRELLLTRYRPGHPKAVASAKNIAALQGELDLLNPELQALEFSSKGMVLSPHTRSDQWTQWAEVELPATEALEAEAGVLPDLFQ